MTSITEALAELKLIEKKIEKKQDVIKQNAVRPDHVKDQFESEGGGVKYIESELQSIRDLRARYVKIRASIAKANMETFVTIGSYSRSITEWLIYKREIATKEGQFQKDLYDKTKMVLDRSANQPQAYKTADDKNAIVNLVSNVNLAALLKENQETSDALEKLDGLLSLKNATTLIEI